MRAPDAVLLAASALCSMAALADPLAASVARACRARFGASTSHAGQVGLRIAF